ncbi:exonuclease [Streptomyces phage Bing]|uniref:Exonuclease n=1 Tax=Streptomyces phage Bing TaxID=2079427 RepID=A0A2L1IWE2_9CAUD|nr:exonuclease [Streptomyces phage Bing]AVD99507.1 exonuclease [Streptomyces phage Bing]
MLSPELSMEWHSHPRLEGSHAVLSPSNYHWLNDSEEKLLARLANAEAAARGTRLHDLAARNIADGITLAMDGRYPVIARYVNDAIKYEMVPEQMLMYSMYCYGTTDAISFDAGEMFLRIHDLKTGVSKASFDQLYVYAGLFCLEYDFKPFEVQGQLRIYQHEEPEYCDVDQGYLAWVYDRIRTINAIVESKMGA